MRRFVLATGMYPCRSYETSGNCQFLSTIIPQQHEIFLNIGQLADVAATTLGAYPVWLFHKGLFV